MTRRIRDPKPIDDIQQSVLDAYESGWIDEEVVRKIKAEFAEYGVEGMREIYDARLRRMRTKPRV